MKLSLPAHHFILHPSSLQIRHQFGHPFDHLLQVAHVGGNAKSYMPLGGVAKGNAGRGGNEGFVEQNTGDLQT